MPRQPHRLSQCAKIMRVLEDGQPHLVSEIHALAGYSRLNSRIAELRKRGYLIESFHVQGKTGSEGYGYRLLDRLTEDATGGSRLRANSVSRSSEPVPGSPPNSSSDGATGDAAPSPLPAHSSSEQLRLVA